MAEAFKVENMGGICRLKTTGTLVLINDNAKGFLFAQVKGNGNPFMR